MNFTNLIILINFKNKFLQKKTKNFLKIVIRIFFRANSIQNQEQCDTVEQLARLLKQFATALPNTIIVSSRTNGQSSSCLTSSLNNFEKSKKNRNACNYVQAISLNTLLLHQQAFLPNEEARKFSHIPKVSYSLLIKEDQCKKY